MPGSSCQDNGVEDNLLTPKRDSWLRCGCDVDVGSARRRGGQVGRVHVEVELLNVK